MQFFAFVRELNQDHRDWSNIMLPVMQHQFAYNRRRTHEAFHTLLAIRQEC